MDIVSAFNPPRVVELAGERFWVRSFTLEDLAILAAWLDDVLPGWKGRVMPPEFGSDEAAAALESAEGRRLMAWVALRHSGVSWERVGDLLSLASPEEVTWLQLVTARRRRTIKARPTADGKDLFAAWWGPNLAAMAERFHLSPEAAGRLSLDQYAMLCSSGAPDEEPQAIDMNELQARWERDHAAYLATREEGVGDACGA